MFKEYTNKQFIELNSKRMNLKRINSWDTQRGKKTHKYKIEWNDKHNLVFEKQIQKRYRNTKDNSTQIKMKTGLKKSVTQLETQEKTSWVEWIK